MGATIFVGNLSPETTRSGLARFFSAAGRVESISFPMSRDTGEPRGFGFVELADPEAAERALAVCSGREPDGRSLRLSWARERESGGAERSAKRGRPQDFTPEDDEPEDSEGRSKRRGSRRSEEEGERRREKPRRHGKHGSDRKRMHGTRRVIE